MCLGMHYVQPHRDLTLIRGTPMNLGVGSIVGVKAVTPWLRCGCSTTTTGRPTVARSIARATAAPASGTTPHSDQRCSGRSQIDVPYGATSRGTNWRETRHAKRKNRASDFAYRVKHDTPQNE